MIWRGLHIENRTRNILLLFWLRWLWSAGHNKVFSFLVNGCDSRKSNSG